MRAKYLSKYNCQIKFTMYLFNSEIDGQRSKYYKKRQTDNKAVHSFFIRTEFIRPNRLVNAQKIRTSYKQSSVRVHQTTLFGSHHFFIFFITFVFTWNDKCKSLLSFKSLFSTLMFSAGKIFLMKAWKTRKI